MSKYAKFNNEDVDETDEIEPSILGPELTESAYKPISPIVKNQAEPPHLNLPQPGSYVRKPLISLNRTYFEWCLPSMIWPLTGFILHRVGKRLAFTNSGILFLAPTILLYFMFVSTFLHSTYPAVLGHVIFISVPVLWVYNRIQLHRVRRRYIQKYPLESVVGQATHVDESALFSCCLSFCCECLIFGQMGSQLDDHDFNNVV